MASGVERYRSPRGRYLGESEMNAKTLIKTARRDLNAAHTIRAARLSDVEAITALINLPGYRRGTMRMPYPDPGRDRTVLSTGAGPNPESAWSSKRHRRRHRRQWRNESVRVAGAAMWARSVLASTTPIPGRGYGSALVGALLEARRRLDGAGSSGARPSSPTMNGPSPYTSATALKPKAC